MPNRPSVDPGSPPVSIGDGSPADGGAGRGGPRAGLVRAGLVLLRAVILALAVYGAWHLGTELAAPAGSGTAPAAVDPAAVDPAAVDPAAIDPSEAEPPEPVAAEPESPGEPPAAGPSPIEGPPARMRAFTPADLPPTAGRPPPRGPTADRPPPAPDSPASAAEAIALLQRRRLLVPVEGVGRRELQDTFSDPRGSRVHRAIDILAPRGTPVLAATEGTIVRIAENALGGRSITQRGPQGLFAYYYAHLDRYAPGLEEGDRVERGQVLGEVGSSGNAPEHVPHLHFAIHLLDEDGRWGRGEPINPYPVLRFQR